MTALSQLARGPASAIALVLAVGGAVYVGLRASPPPTGGDSPLPVAQAASAIPQIGQPAKLDGNEGATVASSARPEPTADPASTEIPRPSDVPPACAEPLVPVEEKRLAGRVRHGCAKRVGDAGTSREGRWIVTEADGRISSGFYVDDLQEGIWTTWYANGLRASTLPFEHGVIHGKQVEWAPSGQRFAERNYRNGALDGPVTITYPDGTVSREEWRQGIRVSQSSGD